MSDDPPSELAAPRGAAAFFDLDKTIVAKASMPAFRRPLRQGGVLTRRGLFRSAFVHLFYLHLRMNDETTARMRSSALKLVKGWEKSRVSEIVEETLERIVDPLIYSEAIDLIEQHHDEHRQVVIVSASPEEIVVPLGRYLGADGTIASSALLDADGRYTGAIAFYAFGEAKAAAIRDYCVDNGLDILASYAYSDSHTDLPMLESVGHPVVVNPDHALESLAAERGWEVRRFNKPVRLRDRMRLSPPRSALAASASAAVLGASAVVVSWWLGRRRESDATKYEPVQSELVSSRESGAPRRHRDRQVLQG